MAILGTGLIAILGIALYLLFTPAPAADAAATPPVEVAESTIDAAPAASRSALPFAEPLEDDSDEADIPEIASDPGPPPEPQPVAADAPGNYMHYAGKLVSVVETIPDEEAGGTALAIDVVAAPAPAAPAEETASGLSAEEELFRAKWGWAATDAIKTSALLEDDTPENP